jgi:thiamine-phosphate pyrophosphorylase
LLLPVWYPILDTKLIQAQNLSLLQISRIWLDAGAKILQFRHKQESSWQAEQVETLHALADLCQEFSALLVVNDRADMAKLAGAALHLGQTDLAPLLARKVVGPLPIGLSTHNLQQLRQADQQPVEYLAIGPIFTTTSKQNPDPQVGLENLPELRRVTSKPLVAIGGITLQTAASVLDAGIDSIAVIGDLFPLGRGIDGVKERAHQWAQWNRR